MKCPNCSETIENDSKFCQHCGHNLEQVDKPRAEDVDKDFINHLEFLGYEIEKVDSTDGLHRYSAKHKSKANLIFNSINNLGVSFVSLYILKEHKVKEKKEEALAMINRMNNRGLFVSFSISPESNSFVCGALYLGKYSKKEFADFLELFVADIQNRLKEEKYLADFN